MRDTAYDYALIGGNTAGSVLASRLSQDADAAVPHEAGASDRMRRMRAR
jgi:choline dehydrogenase-like flavoprotein